MVKIAIKYGFLIVVFLFLWVSMEYILGMQTAHVRFHPLATLLSLVVVLIFLVMGMRESKRRYSKEFTYGRAFQTGIFISLVVALLSPLLQWLVHELIVPGFLDAMRPHTPARMLAQGIDPEVARMELMEPFRPAKFLLETAFGYLVAGLLASAFLAIFMRDKSPG